MGTIEPNTMNNQNQKQNKGTMEERLMNDFEWVNLQKHGEVKSHKLGQGKLETAVEKMMKKEAERLIDFIKKEIQLAKEEERERVVEIANGNKYNDVTQECGCRGWDNALEEVIKRVKEL